MVNLKKIFEDYFNEWLFLYPFDASLLGFDILDEIEEIPVPISEEFKEKEINFYKKYKDLIYKIKIENLNEREKIHTEALKFTCDLALKELSFPDNLLPINHFYSLHLIFPTILSGLNQNFKNKNDIKNLYKKINYFKNWAEESIINLKKGIELKILLPSPVVLKILEQINHILSLKKEKNPFFKPIYLIEKIYKEKNKEIVKEKIEKEIINKIIPSYEKIYNFLKNNYLNKCKEDIGYFLLPNGENWYNAKVSRYTTLDLEPEEIFKFAKNELKELKEKDISLKKEKNIENNYIKFLNNFKKELKEKLKDYFEKIPKNDFKIIPMEKYREKTSSIGEYFLGGIDENSKPIFFLNLNLAKKKSINEVLSIFFHETIPGHHFQISLQKENENLPSFLRYHIFEAFVEGWALYSESLAYEIGIVKDENYRKVILKNQVWRTLRLILDIGIHKGKIKREEAVNILIDEGNFKRKEAEIEILRYAVFPGQALTYKIGEKTFIELKNKARSELKEKFDLKKFHKILLEDGSLPLSLIKEKVENWIKAYN